MSEDAGIEPRTVAITALAVRRSSHSARSYFFPSQLFLSILQRCGATTMAFLFSVFFCFCLLSKQGIQQRERKLQDKSSLYFSFQGLANVFVRMFWKPNKLALLSHTYTITIPPQSPPSTGWYTKSHIMIPLKSTHFWNNFYLGCLL